MNILIIMTLLLMSYTDLKGCYIFGTSSIFLLLLSFINVCFKTAYLDNILGMTAIPFFLVLLNLFKKDSVGEGDIEVLCALGLYVGYLKLVIIFFIAIVLLCLYSLYKKKRYYPLLPFITLSFIAVQYLFC